MAVVKRNNGAVPPRGGLGVSRSNISPPGRAAHERIQPVRPAQPPRQAYAHNAPTQVIRLQRPAGNVRKSTKKKPRRISRTAVRDYFLALAAGLAVFGTAAAFICHALFEMMSL